MEGSVLDRVLERLNEHVKKNRKRLAEFWTSNRLCVTYEEFFKMLDAILFTISRTECQ